MALITHEQHLLSAFILPYCIKVYTITALWYKLFVLVSEISGDAKFCPHCGAEQTSHIDANNVSSVSTHDQKNDSVTFGNAFTSFWKNYFNFSGKSDRSEYWYWVLWQIIITFAALMLIGVLGSATGNPYGIAMLISAIYGIATFFPNLTLTARRMRDSGYNNAFVSIILILFYIFGIFSDASTVCLVLTLIFALVILISVCSPSK